MEPPPLRYESPGPVRSFDLLSRRIIGAAIEVHRRLGPGFREEIYENALCIELEKRGLQFARQVDIFVHYDGIPIGKHTLDLLIEENVILEIKAASSLLEAHQAQLHSYLRAADLRIGLLLNFGVKPLGIKRLVNGYVPAED